MHTSRPARPVRRALALSATALLVTVAGCTSSDDERPAERDPSASAGEPQEPGPADGEAPLLEPLPEEIPPELRSYYDQRLDWGACEDPAGEGFQCATLTVPLDYDAPDPADDLKITVTRQEATDPANRIGALLMNPGGPGASAVAFAQSSATYLFPPEVRDRYDMVAFDARGTGQSHPVECLTGAEMDEHTQTDRTPDDAAEADALRAALTEFGEGCQRRSGELLAHISTIESARDMDLLRAALGDAQLNYVGFSYGTKLGAVYAGLFPERAGRLVLDAAMDPRLPTLVTDREQAGGFETAFRSFAEDCSGLADCPLGTGGADAASDRLADFFADLDAEPLPTGDEARPLTESLASTGVAQALYTEDLWPQLRDALTAAMDSGNGSSLLELADLYNEREPNGSYGTIMFAFPAISCLDSPAGTDSPAEVRDALPAYEDASPTFGADFAWATLQCGVWPIEPSGHPVTIQADASEDILVIGTTRDPATPYTWAQGLAGHLENGILLTNEGDGHGAYATGNPCIDNAVNTYLLDHTSPEEGTTC